jgi:flagellar basal body P-ring formation protein FlgA
MRAILVALLLSVFPLSAFALPVAPPQGTLVSEAEVRRVITDYLMRRTAPLDAQVTIKKIGFTGDLKLPAGQISYEVVAPESWPGYGNSSLALIVRVDDQVKRNQTVQVEVEALAEMLVATRPLERGEVIVASDLTLARRDLTHTRGRFLKVAADAVGLRTKTSVRANQAVCGEYLERVPVVKAGQIVTIVVENDAVRITASGKAKGSGAVGDMIMVQNLSSQKEIAARVVDATTVRVDF